MKIQPLPMTLHMISGPRNMSTAIMYAFAQHPEIKVVDEPFYGVYLNNHPEKAHPGREVILSAMSHDEEIVIQQLHKKQQDTLLFIKNMAHHVSELKNIRWMQQHHI
ncbi:MAG: hypothetical protein LAT76_08335, partial [Schleiferiaceae bacterium]|nr:hypothetical protein [Schleiferiaceae bacterium]